MKDIPTTIAGILGAVGIALVSYFEQHGVSTKDLINIITLAALGFLSKSIGIGKGGNGSGPLKIIPFVLVMSLALCGIAKADEPIAVGETSISAMDTITTGPTNLAEIALDNLEGVAIYVPSDKAMYVGGRFELARSGFPGVTNYKTFTMGLIAGASFLDEKDTTGTHVLAGPDLGLCIPQLVEWAGGDWPNKNLTASLTVGLPYDFGDKKFKAAIAGALVRVQW